MTLHTPIVTVTDLRVVIARTLQEPGFWDPLTYIPPRKSEELSRQMITRETRDLAVADGFARGTAMMRHVAHSVAIADGDEPPALEVA